MEGHVEVAPASVAATNPNTGFYLDAEEPVRAVGFLLAALDRQLSHYLECGDLDEDVHGALDAMVASIRGEHQKVAGAYG